MNYWLPDDLYDAIKWIVTVCMPAATVAYVALAGVWGWPMADQIERTAIIIYTLLCSLMGISSYTAKPIDPTDELWGE